MQRQPLYELTLRFNEQVRIQFAMEALWTDASLDGPYVNLDPPQRVRPADLLTTEYAGAWGLGNVGEDEPVLCAVAYELWPDAPAKVLRVSLERDVAAPRLAAVDSWLAGLGRTVWEALQFEVGLVGDSFVSDWVGGGFWPELPLRPCFGLLWPADPLGGGGLDWYPPSAAPPNWPLSARARYS